MSEEGQIHPEVLPPERQQRFFELQAKFKSPNMTGEELDEFIQFTKEIPITITVPVRRPKQQ